MKRLTILAFAFLLAATAYGQSEVWRTEFVAYDTREDALAGNRTKTAHYLRYAPKPLSGGEASVEVVGENISIPVSWSDYNVYIHLENTVRAYDLVVNGVVAARNEDPYTPADFMISPYLQQGVNQIALCLRRSETAMLNDDAKSRLCEQFADCYIFAQHRLHIFDYDVQLRLDEKGGNALLSLDVVVGNDFNYAEPVNVGYDIYSPAGKLLDYAVREIVVEGRSRDTLRIEANLGEARASLWGNGRAPLYRMMLYIKRNGKPCEYIPFRVGLGESSFDAGVLTRNGRQITVRSKKYDARTSRKETKETVASLRREGYNTLLPSNPQPAWFYDICDELGMYVIERANITPAMRSEDRRINGTPSNNPELLDECLKRAKSMYYRTRNHTCIIAYLMGGDRAGNGYNMYRVYEWLKSVEPHRAVICTTAAGEWNTDIDTIEQAR